MTNNENTMKDIEFIYNDDSRLRLTAKSSIVMALNPDNNVVVAIKGMTPEIFGTDWLMLTMITTAKRIWYLIKNLEQPAV